MGKFRSLFKVRQPGHGEKFEKRVKRAIASAKRKKFPSYDKSNVKGKKAVKAK